jgi:hypothetical protein
MTLRQKIEIICQEYDWKDIANDSKKVARRLAEIIEEDRRSRDEEAYKVVETEIRLVRLSKNSRDDFERGYVQGLKRAIGLVQQHEKKPD